MVRMNRFMEWFDNATIGRKITLICVCLVIIPTLVLGFIAYSSAEAAIKDNIRINLKHRVQTCSRRQRRYMGLPRARLRAI